MLEIDDLSVDYLLVSGKPPLRVVRNVSLEVPPGRVTALIGESGSGKSTLTGALLGLLAPNAQIRSGAVRYDGQDLLRLSAEEMRRFRWQRASVVFQAAQGAFNPTLTLGQQMLDSVLDHDEDVKAASVRVDALLKQVRLEPERLRGAYPHQLSGGMRQRALIAMALVLQPELLILDEPTTALDLITQSYVFEILCEIQRDQGLTMVLITHDLAAVARLADRVAVLYAGTVVEVGDADDIFSRPRHPYTQGLLDAMPGVHGRQPGERARAIDGAPPDLFDPPPGCVFATRCPFRMDRCAIEGPLLAPHGPTLAACHLEDLS